MQRRLIWLAIVGGAAFYILAFFIGENTPLGTRLHLRAIDVGLARAISVVITMALGLGVVNLFHAHGGNVLKRRRGWPLSIVVFVTFFAVLGGLLWDYNLRTLDQALEADLAPALVRYRAACELPDPAAREQALQALSPAEVRLATAYQAYRAAPRFEPRAFYLTNVYNPLAATVMSLLGFYITYAAYRAFRLRSLEATVLMISATVVILGSDPLGGWLSARMNSAWGGRPLVDLPYWADLGNRVANSGMQRGLMIGIAVATIAVCLRILLGLERGLGGTRRGEN